MHLHRHGVIFRGLALVTPSAWTVMGCLPQPIQIIRSTNCEFALDPIARDCE